MRSALTAVMAAVMLFAVAAVAQAGDDPTPENTLPPTFSPPAPAPVTDIDSAQNFIERYAARNAPRFLQTDRRRVRVVDVNSACLQHPVLATHFGCVFTLRALVFQGRRSYGHYARKASDDPTPTSRHRIRVRTFGCLGLARIIGGPSVTPSVTVPLVECARVRGGDYDAPEPTPVA